MEWKKNTEVRSLKIYNDMALVAEYRLDEANGDNVNVVGSFLIVNAEGREDLYSPNAFTKVESTLLTD